MYFDLGTGSGGNNEVKNAKTIDCIENEYSASAMSSGRKNLQQVSSTDKMKVQANK